MDKYTFFGIICVVLVILLGVGLGILAVNYDCQLDHFFTHFYGPNGDYCSKCGECFYVYCPDCGKSYKAYPAFCSGCGHKFN